MYSQERKVNNMVSKEFQLNNLFEENAKVYQTKPVRATKYQPGMETGWVVYMVNQIVNGLRADQHEGMVFFDTKQEAWDYINADNPQYAEVNGVITEIPVEYNAPWPVLHRKETDPEKKTGLQICFEGEYALKSNETEMYDFFVLDCDHSNPDSWIIQDADGSVRVWDEDSPECNNELFFGKEDNYICEKVGDNTYIEVAV